MVGAPAAVAMNDVRRAGRAMARDVGCDPDDGESFALEAWWLHPDMWRTAARRDCIDQVRHEHGKGRRAWTVLLDPMPADGAPNALTTLAVEDGTAQVDDRVTLADMLAGLDDADLAALARVYWLGLPFPTSGPLYVAAMRGLRRVRRRCWEAN